MSVDGDITGGGDKKGGLALASSLLKINDDDDYTQYENIDETDLSSSSSFYTSSSKNGQSSNNNSGDECEKIDNNNNNSNYNSVDISNNHDPFWIKKSATPVNNEEEFKDHDDNISYIINDNLITTIMVHESEQITSYDNGNDSLKTIKPSKNERILCDLNIPLPGNNEYIIFECKISKLNSAASKKLSRNNFLILTKHFLLSFKNGEKAAKLLFDEITKDNKSTPSSTTITNNNKLSENILFSLLTVFAITETLVPEPAIRIDYIISEKKTSYVTIVSLTLQNHKQLLNVIRSTISSINTIGPHLTKRQNNWLVQKLNSLQDLKNNKNQITFKVLLQGITDENHTNKVSAKKDVPVFIALGKNNVYLIPISLFDGSSTSSSHPSNEDSTTKIEFKFNRKISNQTLQYPLLLEENKPKEIDIKRYQYPLLCLTKIFADDRDDKFQLSFKNGTGLLTRTLTISSLAYKTIIQELKKAIDSIIFWWPNPTYQLIITEKITSSSNTFQEKSNNVKLSKDDFERMLEAQCHAFKANRSRIAFRLEHITDVDSNDDSSDNLPFRFTLLPPSNPNSDLDSNNLDFYFNSNNFKNPLETTTTTDPFFYSSAELMAIFNSLKFHPLIYEISFKNIKFFELQIQPNPLGHKLSNMLGVVIYELLISIPNLKKLDLSSCEITSETVSSIANAIMVPVQQQQQQSSLQHLILSNNILTKRGVESLANAIKNHCIGFKELDLSNCKLDSDGINKIIKALIKNQPEKLEIFNLSNNPNIQTSYLSDLLKKTIFLKTLNLRNSQAIFQLKTFGDPIISTKTLGEYSLTTLDIGGIPLNKDKYLEPLYLYIQSSAFDNLRSFSIDHCKLDGEKLALIISYISTSPAIKHIKVWAGGNYLSRSKTGCKELCNTIRSNWTPPWLSLEDSIWGTDPNKIGEILNAFSKNKVIKHLDLSYPNFINDNENDSNDGDKNNKSGNKHNNKTLSLTLSSTQKSSLCAKISCEFIGKMLKDNTSITSLNISGYSERKWGPALGSVLLFLENNYTLEILNIKGNAISDPGAKTLSEALKNNDKLEVLNIDQNEVGIDGYMSLHSLLTTNQNTSIKHFVYPIQDLKTHNESLDAKLLVHSPRELRFGASAIRLGQKISSEKQKVDFRQLIDEIILAIKERCGNADEENSTTIKSSSNTLNSSS
ncbi:3922_t:CDS:2 [Entrophospora sp. SA101]|nr:9363_t:CDS:2 [Entrophospora sp. SA101]CAJ0841145.1 3922_t:CDS:2 [Entrophospora sp. SA101]